MCSSQSLCCCCIVVASYPDLLAPAFVACSTNVGEGLVKLSHMVWRTWTCGGVSHSRKTASKRVRYRLQTRTVERLSAWHQTVLAMFLGFRKPLNSCTEGMCYSSTRPGTSYHVTQFYQAFIRISTATVPTDTGARRPGYEANSVVSPSRQCPVQCWWGHTSPIIYMLR